MQWRWRRAHLGHQHLRQHLLLVLLAQKVGDDARHALRQAHLLHLLVLDVAAQREAHEERLEVDRRRALLAVLRTLARDEGALHVERREARVHLGQQHALERRGRPNQELVEHPVLAQEVREAAQVQQALSK